MNTDGPVPDGSEDAWWSFRTRLSRRVQTLEPGEVVSLVVMDSARKGDGSGGYLQVLATDASWLRGEVSSNDFLAPEHQLDAPRESLLEELGWMPPEPRRSRWKGSPAPNFYLDVELADAADLAVMVVRTMREVFGVTEPGALQVEGLGHA